MEEKTIYSVFSNWFTPYNVVAETEYSYVGRNKKGKFETILAKDSEGREWFWSAEEAQKYIDAKIELEKKINELKSEFENGN